MSNATSKGLTINDLLSLIPADARDLPLCLRTMWDGDERLQAVYAEVRDCEYRDHDGAERSGPHVLIDVRPVD